MRGLLPLRAFHGAKSSLNSSSISIVISWLVQEIQWIWVYFICNHLRSNYCASSSVSFKLVSSWSCQYIIVGLLPKTPDHSLPPLMWPLFYSVSMEWARDFEEQVGFWRYGKYLKLKECFSYDAVLSTEINNYVSWNEKHSPKLSHLSFRQKLLSSSNPWPENSRASCESPMVIPPVDATPYLE